MKVFPPLYRIELNDFGYSKTIYFEKEIIDIVGPKIDFTRPCWDSIIIRMIKSENISSLLQNQCERQGIYFVNIIDDPTLTYKFGMKISGYTKLESFTNITYMLGKPVIFEECWLSNDYIVEHDYIDIFINFKNIHINKGR